MDITTVMVTHNLQHALDYGNRLLMFHDGEIIADIKTKEKERLNRGDLINLFMAHDGIYIDEL